MLRTSLERTPSNLRVFTVCLLLFAFVITPVASLASPRTLSVSAKESANEKEGSASPNAKAAAEVFVNPPAPRAEPAPAPAPLPPVGSVTASMTATLANDDGDNKIDPTNGAANTEKVNYSVLIANSSGAAATGLSFNVPLDSHTSLVGGSLNATPVAFDQSVTLNEDATLNITISGQDPEGSNLTFTNISSPTNGSLGAWGSVTCDSVGVCSQTATYTPNANYFGSDSFTFKVNDGTAASNETGTVSITVNPVNDAPTFTVPGNPSAVNEDAGAQTVTNFITGVRPAQVGNTTENSQTVSFVITNNTNSGLFLSQPALNVTGASYPKTATLTFTPAANQNGTATITYHAHDDGTTANGGVDNSADQTFTITVNAVNDPPVVVAPSAYSAQANMKITGLTGLLGNVNDNADNGVNGCVSTTFTVNAGSISGTTAQGGTVTLTNASTGTFDYDPPAGFVGADTFTYTVNDTGCPGPGVASSPATTVTINVSGPVIWFVNTALGAAGTGRLSAPFNTLAAATAAMGVTGNQRIFVFSGSTTASGTSVTLQGNNTQATQPLAQAQAQWLIGGGAIGTNFDTFFGITPPAGTIARPSINGSRPTIQGTVNVKENTVVEGLNINVGAGVKGLTNPSNLTAGTSGSVVTIADVNVTSTTGNAVDFNNAQTVNYTTSNAGTSPNVLSSTTGIALNVVNTTIGSGGFTFKSISANGGANGIVLNNTGATAGLTVSGDGTNNASGGTIQNNTTNGISLTSTKNVSLTSMKIQNSAHYGITGVGVTNFSFVNGTIDNSGTGLSAQDSNIGFNGSDPAPHSPTSGVTYISGTLTVTGSTLTNSFYHGITVRQDNGTISNLNISNNTFTSSTVSANSNGSAIDIDPIGAAGNHASITTGTINNNTISNFPSGAGIQVLGGNTAPGASGQAVVIGTPSTSNKLTISGNVIAGSSVGTPLGTNGIAFQTNGYATCNIEILNNGTVGTPMKFFAGNAILVGATGFSNTHAKVSNNVVDGSASISSSPGLSFGTDNTFANTDTPHLTLEISSNRVSNSDGNGILATARSAHGLLDIHVLNNIVGAPRNGVRPGIRIDAGNASSSDDAVCLEISGNTSAGSGGTQGIGLRKQGTVTTTNDFGVQGMAATASPNVETYINGQNPAGGGTLLISATSGFSNCTPPAVLYRPENAPPRDYAAQNYSIRESADALSAFFNVKRDFASPEPRVTIAGASIFAEAHRVIEPAQPSLIASTLTSTANFVKAVAAAVEPTAYAAESDHVITDRAELKVRQPEVATRSTDAKLNHAMLANASARSESTLDQIHAAAKKRAVASYLAPFMPMFSGGTFPINGLSNNGFTLPTGKTITITFSVTLNNPPSFTGVPPATPAVSNQGTLTGSFTGNPLLTDDPSVGGATDPTVTNADLFNTTSTITGASPSNSTNTGQAVTFTASIVFSGSGSPAPASGSPSGTATFKDNGTNISGCVGLTVTAGSVQCTTSALTTGVHNNITVAYSGDGSYDPSTSAAFTQTVTQSGTTVTVTSSLNPSLVTQNVTFTATVASTGGFAGPPTGSVTFKDGASTIPCSNGGGVQTLSSGSATCQIATLTAGNHSITAVYGGDTNFTGNTGTLSAAAGQNGDPQVVNKSNTTMNLGTSGSPVTPGTNVTFTATISSATAVSANRTGTVTFYDGTATPGNEITACGAAGVVTVSSNQAQCSTTTLSEATHTITAVYSGDATYNGVTNTVQQVVAKNATTTTLISSQNPSAPTDPVTFTATVTSGAGTPTGNVAFKDNNVNISGCASVALDGGGQAQCLVPANTFSAAVHPITAVYAGTSTFATSTSNTVNQNVISCTNAITVMNTNDSGAGSLRQAIADVCDGGTITFDAVAFAAPGPYTINLADTSNNELLVNKSVTITGPGASVLTVKRISGAVNNFRVFEITSGKTVAISGLTIANGHAAGSFPASEGGGIFNDHGTLTLSNCVLSGNTADDSGGGLFNNAAAAGSASVTIQNCTFASNTASVGGGALYNYGDTGTATATISNSTFNGNGTTAAGGAGGALDNFSATAGTATLLVTNSTISGNTSNGDAGGLVNNASTGTAAATLTSVTITGNHADNDDNASGDGGGINVLSGTVTLKNTIVAGNYKGSATTTANDIFGSVDPASSYNLIGDAVTSGGLINGANFNIVGNSGAGTITTSTILNTTLANNGGPTQTHALVANSPALEKGNAFSLTTDQRGFARPVNYDSVAPIAPYDDTDIGAYELQVQPGAPNAPDLDAASDTGVSNTDNLTSDTSPTFTITGVTPGAFVELLRDANPATGTAQVETATVVGTITPGTNQVETATVVGTITTSGDVSVTVTAAGMNGTPKTVAVAVLIGDDASAVAGKIRTALAADADIGDNTTGFFTVSGSGADVVLTKKTKAANDGTLNIAIDNGTCAGLTAAPTSANTTAGVAPGTGNATVTVTAAGMNNSPKTLSVAVVAGDDASAVAGKMRTALSADPDVSAFFTVSGSNADIVLTAKTNAANDATLNIATANGTCTGLTSQPTSADTTAGAAGPVVVASGTAVGTSIQLTDPSVASGQWLYTARQTVGGAPRSPQSSSLLVTIDTSTPAAPDAPNLDDASDTGILNNDNLTNDTTPTFTIGNVTNGFTVYLLRDDDGPGGNPPAVVASGTASGTSIQLTDPSAPQGTYVYTSRQSNGVNSTDSATGLTVVVDTTPPAAPGTPDLQAGSDTFGVGGTGTNSDNITNASSRSFDISGTTNGVRVELYRGATFIGFTTGNGATVTITDSTSPGDNTYSYTARQVDDAGNFAASSGLNVTIDTTSTAAGVPDLQAGSDSGPSNTDNYTNAASRSFDIPSTENGSLVELYRGATLITSTTGTGGTVTLIDNTAPGDGTYNYTSKQTDKAGNAASSNPLSVTIDTTPNAPGTPDLTAATDRGASNSDNITDNGTHDFTISSENGDLVELLRNGAPVTSTTASGASVTLSDSTSLVDNTYNYTARQTDLAGNVATSAGTLVVTIDTTAPLVVSDTRASANPTSAATVDFTVTFNEDVTGVDTTDFSAVGTGGVTGASVTTVTPVNAKVYTVTVNTGSGDGGLRLDVLNDGSIKDVMNLALGAGFTTGQVYTIDRFNPFVTSITRAGSTPTNTASVDFTVTFSEPVSGVDIADFGLITSGLGGVPAVTNVSPGSGPATTYTVTASTGTGDGTIKLKLNDNNSITDAASKTLAASPGTTENDGTFTPTDLAAKYEIDRTKPGVTINQAGTQTDPVTGPSATTVIHFTAVFTEAVTGFTSTDVSISGTAGATVVNVSQIAPNDGTTYDVAVEGMTQTGTVIADIAAGVAQDSAGNTNTIGTFTDHQVTFNKDDFTNFVVNTTADTDDGQCAPVGTGNGCTLREAINAANADAGAETITFDPTVFASPGPYTITLLTALPNITTDMTIQGPGAKVLTVKRSTAGGTPNFRLFTTSGIDTISGMTITNGNVTGGTIAGTAGGVLVNGGTLTLDSMAISGNTAAGAGGGLFNQGGAVIITSSTINGNTGGNNGFAAGGGGIFGNGGTLAITNSTISGNINAAGGGGIYNNAGNATISNSTLTLNNATGGNGGGIYRAAGTVTLKSTIVGANSATTAPDIFGAVNSEGYNLVQSTTGATITETLNPGTNITGQDPLLNALADNGGPTMTHSLQCTSAAIDKGKAFGLTSDQRGGTRPLDFADAIFPNAAGGDGTDIGAFETQAGGGCVPEAQPPNPQPTTNEDNAVVVQLKAVYSQNVQMTFSISQNPANGTLGPIQNTTCSFNLSTTCTATIQYTPNQDYFGSDIFKFTAATNPGGLTSDPAEVDVTINSVNDPPSFLLGPNQTILEDAGPQTVSNFANTISVGPANEAGQTYQFIVQNNTNPGLFSAAPALDTTGTLTYTAAPDKNGSATITFVMKDSGGGADTSAPHSFTINVLSVNDAPTFTKGADPVVDENAPQQTINNWATAISPGPADESGQTVNFKVIDFTNPSLFSVGPLINSNGTLTFTPAPNASGTSTATIVLKDNGGTANGGVDTSPQQTFTITIREGGSLQLSSATYSVGESGGNAVITVTRTGGNAGATSVQFATSNGTATAGSDYTAVSQTVTFSDGDTTPKTINIPITNDLLNESNETVNITLSGITGSGELGSPSTAVLTIGDDDPVGGYLKFSSANYSVAEGGVATITVQRLGTLTQAVTVDYATSDNSTGPQVSCAPTPGNTLASSRCDYTSAFGQITFAAGDGADKTFTVLIDQDSYVEGPETLSLTLSNPTNGASLVTPSAAILTINDDLTEPPTNLADDTNTFVEQLYRDFLNRPSDPAGKAFWVNNIDSCGSNAACREVRRIDTAAAFFLSIEFQVTGGTAYLTNKAAFGTLPTFLNFEPDAQAIGKGYVFGQPGADAILEANKVAYFNAFVARSSFTAIYGGMSNTQYVDALITNTGVSFTSAERNALINGLNNATETRATVLRKVGEKASFRDAEFNRMFVFMEYVGFLRRDPDTPGFNFWLTKLNQFNGNYIAAEMIKAFISSAEYRGRFGP